MVKLRTFTPEEIARDSKYSTGASGVTAPDHQMPDATWGDYGNALGSGTVDVAAGVAGAGEYLGIPGAAEASANMRGWSENIVENMTPAAKFEMSREWATVGEEAAWRNLSSFMLSATKTLPTIATSVIPGAALAKAGAGAKTLAAAGAATEGTLSGGMTQSQISGEIDKLTPGKLRALAEAHQIDIEGMDDGEARTVVKEGVSKYVVPTVAAVGAGTGALLGPLQAKLFGKAVNKDIATAANTTYKDAVADGVSKTEAGQLAAAEIISSLTPGVLKSMGVSGGVESGQEFFQSLSEQIGQNYAMDRPWDEGLAEAGVSGTMLGGAVGAPMGIAAGSPDTIDTMKGVTVAPDIKAALDAYNNNEPAPVEQQVAPAQQAGIPVPGGAPTGLTDAELAANVAAGQAAPAPKPTQENIPFPPAGEPEQRTMADRDRQIAEQTYVPTKKEQAVIDTQAEQAAAFEQSQQDAATAREAANTGIPAAPQYNVTDESRAAQQSRADADVTGVASVKRATPAADELSVPKAETTKPFTRETIEPQPGAPTKAVTKGERDQATINEQFPDTAVAPMKPVAAKKTKQGGGIPTAKATPATKNDVPKKTKQEEKLEKELGEINKTMKKAQKAEPAKEAVDAKLAKTRMKKDLSKGNSTSTVLKNPDMGFNKYKFVGGGKGKGGFKKGGKQLRGKDRDKFYEDVDYLVTSAGVDLDELRKAGVPTADLKEVKALLSSIAMYTESDATNNKGWEVDQRKADKESDGQANINKFIKKIGPAITKAGKGKKVGRVAGPNTKVAKKAATAALKKEAAEKAESEAAEKIVAAKETKRKADTAERKAASKKAIKKDYDNQETVHGTERRGVATPAYSEQNFDSRARQILAIVMGTQSFLDSDLSKKLGIEGVSDIQRTSRTLLKKIMKHQPLTGLTDAEVDLKNKLFDEYVGIVSSDGSLSSIYKSVEASDAAANKENIPANVKADERTTAISMQGVGQAVEQFLKRIKAKYAKDFGTPAARRLWERDFDRHMRLSLAGTIPVDDALEGLVELGLSKKEIATATDLISSWGEQVRKPTDAVDVEALNDQVSDAVIEALKGNKNAAEIEALLNNDDLNYTEEYGFDDTADTNSTAYDFDFDQDDMNFNRAPSEGAPDSRDRGSISNSRIALGELLNAMGHKRTINNNSIFRKGIIDAPNMREMINIMLDTLDPKDPYVPMLKLLAESGINDKVIFTNNDAMNRLTKDPEGSDPAFGFFIELKEGNDIAGDGSQGGLIAINLTAGQGGSNITHTILHEMVHAATVQKINSINMSGELDAPVQRLLDLYNQAMENTELVELYGYTDIKEFIAEAMTNPDFQKDLNGIPMPGGSKYNVQSMWDAFIQGINDLLGWGNYGGVTLDTNSVLYGVLSVAPEIFQNAEGRMINRQLRDPMSHKRAGWGGEGGNAMMGAQTASISDAVMEKAASSYDTAEGGFKTNILRWMTLDQMVSKFTAAFEKAAPTTYRNLSEYATNPLKALNELMHKKTRMRTAITNRAEKRDRVLRKYEMTHGVEAVAEFGDLLNNSTIMAAHIDRDFKDPSNAHLTMANDPNQTQVNLENYTELRARFDKLPKGLRAEYDEQRTFYKQQHDLLRASSIENLAQIYGGDQYADEHIKTLVSDLTSARDTDAINAAYEKAAVAFEANTSAPEGTQKAYKSLVDNARSFKKEVRTINASQNQAGPYFPLKRYGKYQINGVNAAGKKVYIRSDSSAELEQTRAALAESGATVSEVTVSEKVQDRSSNNMAQMLDTALNNAGNGTEAAAIARIAIMDAYASMSPETSIQKHFMKRRGILGASTNVRQNLASYQLAVAGSVASLKYSSDIHKALGSMRAEQRRGDGNDGERSFANVEMSRRINEPPQPAGTFSSGVANYAFVNYLLSISYSIVNSTQVALVTLPRMSEAYGIGESTAAIAAAYKTIAPQLGKALKKSGFGRKAFTAEGVDLDVGIEGILSKLDGTEREMMETLRERDMLGGGLTFDITESAKNKTRSKFGTKYNMFIEMGRTMPMMVEEMNRTVTALATYRLAMKKHGDHKQAVKAAEHMIVKTHFDYSDMNKPPMFTKNGLLRAVTMYKMHPLGVYENLAHYINNIKDPATRTEGLKGLAMFMGMHSLVAGAAGGVLLEPIALAMQAIALGLDDEDEAKIWFEQPDIAMRELTYMLTGSEKASEVMTYGLPRLFGADMYSRVGTHRLMVQIGQGDSALDTMIDSIEQTVGGPVYAMREQVKNFGNHMAMGDSAMSSISYLAPKVVRDVIRAFGNEDAGMKDYRGNTIVGAEEFGVAEGLSKAIGFGTSVEAEAYSNRNRDRARKANLKSKREMLIREWKSRSGNDAQRYYMDNIKPFTRSLSDRAERKEFGLNQGDLRRSGRSQKKREKDTRGGVYRDKNKGNIYDYSTIN